jgi:type II secretory pathway pseudopilin PulG
MKKTIKNTHVLPRFNNGVSCVPLKARHEDGLTYIAKPSNINNQPSTANNAFSIIELALVLVIIGVITASGLSLASNQITNSQIEQTRQKMDVIEKLLQDYALTYGQLPCPASPIEASTDVNFGVGKKDVTLNECTSNDLIGDSSTNGQVVGGLLPFKTMDNSLDASLAIDAWGNRIIYFVDEDYTSPTNTTGYGTSNSNSANTGFTIRTRQSGGNDVETTSSKVAFVLISYGPNGYYGRPNKAPSIVNKVNPNPPFIIANYSANEDEIQNGDILDPNATSGPTSSANSTFVVKFNDKNFDDIIRYKVRAQLE